MPFVVTFNTVQCEIRYLFDNQQCENTLYFEYESAPTVSQGEDLADALFDWWDTNLKPMQCGTLALREIYLTDLTAADSWAVTRVSSPIVPGTRSGESMPNNIALCISFRTNQRGRAHRGRNYAMAMGEGDVSNNNFTTGYLTGIQDAYVALADVETATGANWVVVSRFQGLLPRENGITTPVSSVGFFDGVVDSQRRRLPGRGS